MSSDAIRLEILSPEQIERIHQATLTILADTGIVLQHQEAREMLLDNGCQEEEERVKIPAELVEKALSSGPRQIAVWGRDRESKVVLGDERTYAHNAGGIPTILDLETGQRRAATLQDVEQTTRLLDALPNVHTITSLVSPQDVAGEMMHIHSYGALLSSTKKPVYGPGIENERDAHYALKLAAAVCGGWEELRTYPPLSISVSPISPLTFSHDVTAAILTIARAGVPFVALPAPISGASSPITLAAGLAQQNAENLACLVLARLVEPAAPVVYCSRLSVMDMRTALSAWGNPEIGLTGACAVQLAKRYGLPNDVYGFCSSSKMIDVQSGYERTFNALLPALAGADTLSGVGSTENGLTASYELAVLDDEILDMVFKFSRGFRIDDGTLALDLLAEVMASDTKTFLDKVHTVQHMRAGEIWIPRLSDRTTRDEWEVEKKTALDLARDRAREILAYHQVAPLPQAVQEEISSILEEAEKV